MKAYMKQPGQDPEVINLNAAHPKEIISKVGGAFYRTPIQLSTGKVVELFSYQMAIREGLEYNFSICPTDDKRTWIDISGPVLVTSRNIQGDLELLEEEEKEIFRVPYEC